VIGADLGHARHRCPRPSCRIPHFRFVCWIGHRAICTLGSSASASHQDFAVRKQCGIVEFASSRHHRSSVLPSGTGTIQVNDLCGCRGISGAIANVKSAWAPAHDQHLTIIVHHCCSPITSPVVAIPYGAPSTSASNIKVPRRLSRPSAEYPSVRRRKHVWIERLRQMRCGQVAPGSSRTLPYLRLHIDVSRGDRATDRQHVSVRQGGARRIPSTVIHVRQARPGIVQRIIPVGIGQPHPGAYVSTGY
jgi:hypothetical protein